MIPESEFSHTSSRKAFRCSQKPLFWAVSTFLLVCLFVGTDLLASVPLVAAAALPPVKLPIAQASFTLQQFLKQGHPYVPQDTPLVLSKNPPAPPRGIAQTKKLTVQPAPSSQPATMKAVSQTISSSTTTSATSAAAAPTSQAAIHLVGSDPQGARLEVLIPAGALDLSHATTTSGAAPQGSITIALTQLHGHAVGMTNELGSFLMQVTDSQGLAIHGIKLSSPMTITYHYRPKELFFMDLNPSKLFLVWPELVANPATTTPATTTNVTTTPITAPTTSATPSTTTTPVTTPLVTKTTNAAVIPMQDQAASSTLVATSTVLDSSIMAVGISDPENQTPAKPRFASVQGNTGQLDYSYPLTVAPGPKGTAPSLAMTYSSAESNGRTSPRSPAENTGEGWALTLGSISEEKEAGGSVWYFINGVDNVSDRLIPDSTTIQAGTNFGIEHLSYLKVKMVNASFDSQQCFQVWDTEGNYYQFGCTPDSLQYYTDSSNNRTNYRYDLNQMIPANEGPSSATRVLNSSYLADGETNVGGHYSITDAVLKQITYGTSTSADLAANTTTTVSGTVDFFYKGATAYTDGNGVQWVTAYDNIEQARHQICIDDVPVLHIS